MEEVEKRNFENMKFGPGNQAGKARGKVKQRITTKILNQFEADAENGRKTPYSFWMAILNDEVDFTDVKQRDVLTLQLKAAEHLARFVYDASFETEEAEAIKMSPEQIAALKAAFPKMG